MKKLIFIPATTIAVVLFVFACKKEINPVSQNTGASSHLESDKSNDNSLIAVLNNPNLSDYEKGNLLIAEASLSPSVIDKVIDKAGQMDPYVIELILSSQTDIDDSKLLKMINKPEIDNQTLKNVLFTRKGLNEPVKNEIRIKRNDIQLNEVSSFNQYDKLICLCRNQMIFAEKITEVVIDHETQFIIENPIYRPFSKSITETHLNAIATGCAEKWICGNYEETVKNSGDFVTVTGHCFRPPNDKKCVKRIDKNKMVSNFDSGLINLLKNSATTDYMKGKQLLNLDEVSNSVTAAFIDLKDEFSDDVFETTMYSIGKINDDNLVKVIANPKIKKEVVENIMIINSPLSERISKITAMYRPEIDVQNVNEFANKQVAISLCAQRLFIGSNITIEKTANNDHEITISDLIEKPFASSINESQYSQMIAGCGGRYVCGDLVTISGEPQDHETKFKCVSPPNRKCIKKAK